MPVQKITPIIALAAASLVGCGKDDENTAPASQAEFVIDGIRDVRVDSGVSSNLLPLSISRPANSTKQEAVTLTAPDLPAGFSASFDPASGTPSFASTVTFSYDYSGDGGTFPAKIVGTSASGSKTYTLNLTAPALINGWVFDGESYGPPLVSNTSTPSTASIAAFAGNPPTELYLRLAYQQILPTTTQTYKIVKNATAADEVSFYVKDKNSVEYFSSGAGAPTGTITVTNGTKYGFRCNNVEVISWNGNTKKRFSCKFSQ